MLRLTVFTFLVGRKDREELKQYFTRLIRDGAVPQLLDDLRKEQRDLHAAHNRLYHENDVEKGGGGWAMYQLYNAQLNTLSVLIDQVEEVCNSMAESKNFVGLIRETQLPHDVQSHDANALVHELAMMSDRERMKFLNSRANVLACRTLTTNEIAQDVPSYPRDYAEPLLHAALNARKRFLMRMVEAFDEQLTELMNH